MGVVMSVGFPFAQIEDRKTKQEISDKLNVDQKDISRTDGHCYISDVSYYRLITYYIWVIGIFWDITSDYITHKTTRYCLLELREVLMTFQMYKRYQQQNHYIQRYHDYSISQRIDGDIQTNASIIVSVWVLHFETSWIWKEVQKYATKIFFSADEQVVSAKNIFLSKKICTSRWLCFTDIPRSPMGKNWYFSFNIVEYRVSGGWNTQICAGEKQHKKW